MTLEQLKAALDAAATALATTPDDEALKAKHLEAKTAYDAALVAAPKPGADKDGQVDVSKLDPNVQKIIRDLRTENASARTKNKELETGHGKLKTALIEAGLIEDDAEAPEEKVKKLSEHTGALTARNAILEAAIENSVSKDGMEFFEFLVGKRLDSLEEGGELSQEDIAAIAQEVQKKIGGSSQSSSTSVGDKGGKAPAPGASGDVTLDQFVKMNLMEKSTLYSKNKELYNQLLAEAKEKKRLVS